MNLKEKKQFFSSISHGNTKKRTFCILIYFNTRLTLLSLFSIEIKILTIRKTGSQHSFKLSESILGILESINSFKMLGQLENHLWIFKKKISN